MKWISFYRKISNIIPQQSRTRFRRLCYASVVFSLLDLISVAYLVPAILLLLDRNRFSELLPTFLQSVPQSSLVITGILLLIVFYAIKNMLQTRFNNRLHQFLYGLSHELSMDIIKNYLGEDYLSYQQNNKGNLIRNITTLTRDFSVSLLGSLLLLSSEALTFGIIVLALLFFYFKLTLLALFGIGVFAMGIYRIKKSEVRLINNTYKDAAAKANAELLNILDGYIEIKSSGNPEPFLNQFRTHNKALNRVTALLTASTGNYSKYLELFLIVGIAGLLLFNVFFSAGNNLVLLSVLGALSIKLLPSLSKILNAVTMVNSHFYSVAMLHDMTRIQNTPKIYPEFNIVFELRGIDFAYMENVPVFKNLSFKIGKGEITGIKGITGAGKTTFLHIASGLLAPDRGSVFIDGVMTEDAHFFPFISYVSQQPFLFNGTLLENISMREHPEKIDYEYIHYLAENLELSALLDNLEHGLQTVITHNTSKLSGGQKQRLALLRALYHRPQLLILDEATNQQNEALENKIYTFLRRIADNDKLSVITVSHHNAMHSFCDNLYVLEQNKLTESLSETRK